MLATNFPKKALALALYIYLSLSRSLTLLPLSAENQQHTAYTWIYNIEYINNA